MAKNPSYHEGMKEELEELIAELPLDDLHKRFLRSRWLDQVVWMEGRATATRNRHYFWRLITILGGVLVPALVSRSFGETVDPWVNPLAFGISLAVAISAAVEEFFRYGDRWRNYRRSVSALLGEGWQFLQRAGGYRDYDSYQAAFEPFAARVEGILQADVAVYITEVLQGKDRDQKDGKIAEAGGL